MSITPDDRPQREQLMDPTSPTAPTMGASDIQEHEMSTPTRQPSTDPGRGRRRAYIAGGLVAAVAAATVGVILLTGKDDKPTAGPTTPPPVAVSTTPSLVPSSPPRPQDVAAEAAEAAFLRYVGVANRVSQGGYKNVKLYDPVAVSPARTQLALEARKSAGITAKGDAKVTTLGVTSVKLSNDTKKAFSEVGLKGCLDVQGVTAFYADGRSAVASTRIPRIAFTALIQMVPASALGDGRPSGWYLSKLDYPGGGTPC